MKYLIYILILTISNSVIAENLNLELFKNKSTSWLQAFYAQKTEILSALQSDPMNKNQELLREKTSSMDIKNLSVAYNCNNYYVHHIERTNKLNNMFSSKRIGNLNITSQSKNDLILYFFNECGINFVEHISAFKLTYNVETGLLINYNILVSEYDKSGYSEEQISAKVEAFSIESKKVTFDANNINLKEKISNLKKRMEANAENYK